MIDWKISSLNADAKKIELDYKLNEFESLTSTESSEEFICSQINLNDDGYLKVSFAQFQKSKIKIISVLMDSIEALILTQTKQQDFIQ